MECGAAGVLIRIRPTTTGVAVIGRIEVFRLVWKSPPGVVAVTGGVFIPVAPPNVGHRSSNRDLAHSIRRCGNSTVSRSRETNSFTAL